jgi:hypothetical protein
MAVIKKGNALTTLVYQKGVTIQNDGYGLLTSTVVWQGDTTATPPAKGDAHPIRSYMKAFKVTSEYSSTQRIIYKVDYVGIVSDGDNTTANMSGAVGLQTERTESHPNFFRQQLGVASPGSPGTAIAGYGSGTYGAPVYAASSIVPGEFVGLNGAHFKTANGTTFTGFKDPAYPSYFAKNNYLAGTTTLSGIMYVKSTATVQRFWQCVGRSSLESNWNAKLPTVIPAYIGTSASPGWEGKYGAKLLLSSVNFEEYGVIYKCTYTIRLNNEGWPEPVYPLAGADIT